MGLLVLAAAVAATVWPSVFNRVPTSSISYLLGVVMFGMGLTLRAEDFRVLLTRPRDVFIGSLCQFTIMPLLAFALARLFRLDDALALGVVLVGCCPGGTASNVITYLCRGDVALSIGITSLSTLLAPLATPLLTWLLAGEHIQVNVFQMFLSILWVIILPIVAGAVVKRLWPRLTERAAEYLPAFSSLAIAFIVAIVVSASAERLLRGGAIVILVVMLHNVGGLLLGYVAARLAGLPVAKQKTIAIEVGMQNSGLASSLAATHFAAFPMATIPGAIFSVWHNISGAIVARLFRDKGDGENPNVERSTMQRVARGKGTRS